jgi:Tol biopolymer transport system component
MEVDMRRHGMRALLAITVLGLAGCASVPNGTAHTPTAAATAAIEAPGGTIVFRQFLNGDESQGALFSIRSDGSNKTQLTKPARTEIDGQPDWSPDGTKIVFTVMSNSGSPQESHHVELMNSDGTDSVALTPESSVSGTANFDDQPAFSPDGTLIAYAHADGVATAPQLEHTGIYVMNSDGSNRHEVVTMPDYAADVGGIAWSPDGKQLVYGVFNTGNGMPSGGRAFFLVSASGAGNHQLTEWALQADGTPDWSAATNLILFRVAPNEESGVGNFFTIHPDGTGQNQATNFTGTEISHKAGFSPDGKWIVYGAAGKDGVVRVNLARSDGSDARVLVVGGGSSSAADWSPVS